MWQLGAMNELSLLLPPKTLVSDRSPSLPITGKKRRYETGDCMWLLGAINESSLLPPPKSLFPNRYPSFLVVGKEKNWKEVELHILRITTRPRRFTLIHYGSISHLFGIQHSGTAGMHHTSHRSHCTPFCTTRKLPFDLISWLLQVPHKFSSVSSCAVSIPQFFTLLTPDLATGF